MTPQTHRHRSPPSSQPVGSSNPEGHNNLQRLGDVIIERMIQAARDASQRAYVPYSNFPVGAAILSSSGQIYAGCNVENASFGLTMCAERNAIFNAVAQENLDIEAVIVYTKTDKPTAPCGACRQVIHEFGPRARVLCVCDGPDTIRMELSDLLPESFGPQNLT